MATRVDLPLLRADLVDAMRSQTNTLIGGLWRLTGPGRLAGARPQSRYAESNMPVVSRFLGIVIAMYWDDHVPAHFHAKYGEYEIIVQIATGAVEGRFPKRALRHVLEWHELHQDELLANWERCRRKEAPNPIEPLE